MVGSDQKMARPLQNPKWKSSIISWFVSLSSVFFTQFALASLALFFPASPFLALIPLAVLFLVIVVGLGRVCKSIAGVRASPPAYVLFSVLFTWAVYMFAVRQAVPYLVDIVFNAEIIAVIVGHSCIISVDPGFVSRHSSCNEQCVQSPLSEDDVEGEEWKFSSSIEQLESTAEEGIVVHRRVRYCRHCQKFVLGFDHHCPAFGNCIGQRNHLLFMGLLVGFVMSEASFVACASQFTVNEVRREGSTWRYIVTGTMLFCVTQVLWQVVFIMWHVYCACFNITTDEWINWKKYPEFQVQVTPHPGEPRTATLLFTNPYDKGILRNLKDFLMAKG